jgi:hypothetical protein
MSSLLLPSDSLAGQSFRQQDLPPLPPQPIPHRHRRKPQHQMRRGVGEGGEELGGADEVEAF